MSPVDCPGEPTTLKRRFISVPEPLNVAVWNMLSSRCPGLFVFGVTVAALLNVPVVSKGGEAGVTTKLS